MAEYPTPIIPARPGTRTPWTGLALDGIPFDDSCRLYTSEVVGHVDTAVQTAWDVIDNDEYAIAEARYDDLAAATETLMAARNYASAAIVAQTVAPSIIERIAAALRQVGYHLNEDFEAEEDDLEDYFSDDDDDDSDDD